MKRILQSIILMIVGYTFAQVGVGTPIPNESAQLEIVSNSKRLYFSSNGGGYDVYYIDLKNENEKLLNIGNAINDPHDDFTFLSFGRFGIKNDELGLNETKLLQGFFQMEITMVILDSETGKPIKRQGLS